MTIPNDLGTAPAGGGAAEGSTSNTEVTELRTQLEASQDLVAKREVELMAANTSITDLTGANKKFADDAVRMANTGQQLKDVQSQLEESRKTSSTLTEQLEQAKTSNSTMVEQMTTRRRQDLVSRYGLSEERVANLDDAKLAVLEDELPHVTPAPANSASLPANGTGLGLGGGGGSPDLSTLSESDRALRTIERLKDKN